MTTLKRKKSTSLHSPCPRILLSTVVHRQATKASTFSHSRSTKADLNSSSSRGQAQLSTSHSHPSSNSRRSQLPMNMCHRYRLSNRRCNSSSSQSRDSLLIMAQMSSTPQPVDVYNQVEANDSLRGCISHQQVQTSSSKGQQGISILSNSNSNNNSRQNNATPSNKTGVLLHHRNNQANQYRSTNLNRSYQCSISKDSSRRSQRMIQGSRCKAT